MLIEKLAVRRTLVVKILVEILLKDVQYAKWVGKVLYPALLITCFKIYFKWVDVWGISPFNFEIHIIFDTIYF